MMPSLLRRWPIWGSACIVALVLAFAVYSFSLYRSDRSNLIFHPRLSFAQNETLPYDALRIKLIDPQNLYDKNGSLAINYSIENTSSKAINLRGYQFNVIANTDLPEPDSAGTPNFVLPHSSVNGWYVIGGNFTGSFLSHDFHYVSFKDQNSYSGPLELMVSRPGRITKTLTIR